MSKMAIFSATFHNVSQILRWTTKYFQYNKLFNLSL